jgi:hypothetical protein
MPDMTQMVSNFLILPKITLITDGHCRIFDPLTDPARLDGQECDKPDGEAKDCNGD